MSNGPLRYLLDTNIVSALANDAAECWNSPCWRRWIAREPGSVGISVAVQCELMFGSLKKPDRRRDLRQAWVCRQLPVAPIPHEGQFAARYAALRAALERKGAALGAMDLFIATHALLLDATLVTNDRDFERVEGLRREDWLAPDLLQLHEAAPRWSVG